MNLSRVSIGIKTFLRDDKLFNTIQAIRDTMPEVQMIVADDGDASDEKEGVYSDLLRDGHEVICMPFDSGFGAKSNMIARVNQRPYLLIGSDDFDFRPPSVRQGIEIMFYVLEHDPSLSVVSGRVRGSYEFNIEDQGDTIVEHRVYFSIMPPVPLYFECDLTVNYSLIRREIFQKVSWDDDVKIGGGEHGAFFVDIKRAGFKVAVAPGAQISEQQGEDSDRYKQFRKRASSSARPCFDRRGIRKYVLGSGKIDYEKIDYKEPLTR